MSREVFKENISLIRGVWKLSQSEMADLFSITGARYQTYETVTRLPDFEFIFRLEDLTGILAKRLWTEKISSKEIPEQPRQNDETTKETDPYFEAVNIIEQQMSIIKNRMLNQ